MPIRPENLHRYPPGWPQISLAIRDERAGWRCECAGECGARHGGRCTAVNELPHPVTHSLVILTVAHLDHTPENCDPANLRAMCQRCHLRYDAPHHARTAALTRHRALTAGMTPLFDLDGS
ncbi:hypothetical protein Lfu02_31390 [Longispora fulva]|uniref:HNH endonuclease n=1 Tax=Longispora fulva TaxID=619741 RepID=A0A8J7GVT3_9ACTN|nr:hypothetical protein [Longispora fulva]MBG6139273.1 hypothetical protein [Longispora fulva]GIG58767.1 hypothetical protein Lfu02_31390 [Longispora fulva]